LRKKQKTTKRTTKEGSAVGMQSLLFLCGIVFFFVFINYGVEIKKVMMIRICYMGGGNITGSDHHQRLYYIDNSVKNQHFFCW